ncbi:MAG TPA: UvrB/UvrC motif-containing protein [Gemmatimonadaceae bacterium]|jgi:protein arginine kinase activator
MLCDQCKERDAVVHLTQIVNAEVTQLHLCEKCAAAKGIETTVAMPKHPLGDFLHAVQQQSAPSVGDQARCAYCQTSLRDFRASGRLGCAQCYTAFEGALRELLRRVHGAARHRGREYDAPVAAGIVGSELDSLRERLQRAVAAEEFELAAALRDQIRALE